VFVAIHAEADRGSCEWVSRHAACLKEQFFSEGVEGKFSLVDIESYDNGALHLVYRPLN
jgi:hypothetical protein